MPTTPPGIHGVWPSYLEPMDTEVTTNRFDYNLQPPYTYISKNKGHLQSASYYGRKSLSADNFINKFINNFLQLNFSILYSYIKIPDWHCPGDRSCDRSGRFPQYHIHHGFDNSYPEQEDLIATQDKCWRICFFTPDWHFSEANKAFPKVGWWHGHFENIKIVSYFKGLPKEKKINSLLREVKCVNVDG